MTWPAAAGWAELSCREHAESAHGADWAERVGQEAVESSTTRRYDMAGGRGLSRAVGREHAESVHGADLGGWVELSCCEHAESVHGADLGGWVELSCY